MIMSSKQQELINFHSRRLQGLLGKPSSALDTLEKFKAPGTIIVPDTYETIQAPDGVGKANETWYPGSISVGGFVYSKVDVRFNFGSYGDYDFSAGFWGAFGGGAGGGGGPWVDGALPRDNEEMEFQIAFGAVTGGSVEMFWWRAGGPIQGGFVGVIGGLGAGGSKGTGKWKKA
jgi:hypothetical protein